MNLHSSDNIHSERFQYIFRLSNYSDVLHVHGVIFLGVRTLCHFLFLCQIRAFQIWHTLDLQLFRNL